jgi:hypothetical protein
MWFDSGLIVDGRVLTWRFAARKCFSLDDEFQQEESPGRMATHRNGRSGLSNRSHLPFSEAESDPARCRHPGFRITLQLAAIAFMLPVLSALGQFAPVSPGVYEHVPLRLLGTNLMDFSPLIASVLKEEGSRSGFLLKGTVSRVADYVFIKRDLGVVMRVKGDLLSASGGDLLRMMSLNKMIEHSNGKLSAGQYYALDPTSRSYLVPEQQTEMVVLTNCPGDLKVVGREVFLFAWPCGLRATGGKGGQSVLPCFDFGTKFTGELKDYSFFLQISPMGGIVRKPLTNVTNAAANEPGAKSAKAQ